MRKIPRDAVLTALHHLGLHHVSGWLRGNRVRILMYHGFTDRDRHSGIENHQGKHLPVAEFGQQIGYLKKHYTLLSLDDLIGHYAKGTSPPKKSVVITFDDGYKSNYLLAYPVLRQYDAPATIFVTTEFVDENRLLWTDRLEYAINTTKLAAPEFQLLGQAYRAELGDREARMACDRYVRSALKSEPGRSVVDHVERIENALECRLSFSATMPDIYRPLEWDDISEMLKSGIVSLGSHTHSHAILTRCAADQLANELELSLTLLQSRTGGEVSHFCYPNGAAGDFDARTKQALIAAGYRCGLTTVDGTNDRRSDVFELKRCGITAGESTAEFAMRVAGVVKFLSDLRRRIESRAGS